MNSANRPERAVSRLLLLVLPLAAWGGGCASFTTLGTARTVDRGTSQIYVAPEVTRVTRGGKPLLSPQAELGGRYGLTSAVEVGVRVWLPNAAVDTKVQLHRAPTPDAGFDLALDPSVGYLGGFSGTATGDGDTLHIVTLGLPLLVGWNTGGGNQLVGSVRIVDQIWTGTGNATMTANLLYLGGSLSFVWKLTDGLRLAPEVAFGSPGIQTLTGFGTAVGFSGLSAQAGVAVLFGGDALPPPVVTPPPALVCPSATAGN